MTATVVNDSFAEYLASPRVNNGTLCEMAKSPLHYRTARDRPKDDTEALSIGRHVHAATLEPERWEESHVRWEGGLTSKGEHTMSKNSGAYKQFKAAAERDGLEILTEAELYQCRAVSTAVRSNPDSGPFLSEPGAEFELSIYWTHRFGIEMKIRADILHRGNAQTSGYLADLKTARDITPDGFGRAANSYEYHCQLALYQDGVEALTGKKPLVYIIAAEKVAPFDVAVYEVPEAALELGRSIYEDRLAKVARGIETNSWPGVGAAGIQTLELPEYAYKDEMIGRIDLSGIEVEA